MMQALHLQSHFLPKTGDDFARQCLGFHEEEERMSSMEIIVGIDEDDFSHTPDSDIDQADDGMCSPEEGEISEEDVSDDEDYMPASRVQTDGAITAKTSLNATVQQPPAMDQIQVHKIMPYHQIGNQEKSPAENLHQDKEHFEKISSAERPSWPSGTSSVLPWSELGRTPMKTHLNKAGAEVKHHEAHRPETQDKSPSSAPVGELDSKGQTLRSSEDASEHSPYDSQETQPEEPKPHQGPQTPKNDYVCPTCGKVFSQNQGLKRHLMIHSGKRPFKCFTCGRGFTQSGNLKTHMRVHEDKKKLLASS
ncbi:uncharacterized protein PAE49_004075 isoform 2-T2 [Odontesthes bonariensis]|uniref:uncharacterized protein LOC142378999 isoform X2 n=1 Tax=Odontesthes bonariensis TaxID=219752 RepID=UPI003F585B25